MISARLCLVAQTDKPRVRRDQSRRARQTADQGEIDMRVIPTRVHGVLDYVVGALLIAAPWLFHFNEGGAETWVPVVLGAGAILYSLCTDYELGLLRLIPMATHLMLDLGSGVLLALSPWLFGF